MLDRMDEVAGVRRASEIARADGHRGRRVGGHTATAVGHGVVEEVGEVVVMAMMVLRCVGSTVHGMGVSSDRVT